jgi:hypothetical protein
MCGCLVAMNEHQSGLFRLGVYLNVSVTFRQHDVLADTRDPFSSKRHSLPASAFFGSQRQKSALATFVSLQVLTGAPLRSREKCRESQPTVAVKRLSGRFF